MIITHNPPSERLIGKPKASVSLAFYNNFDFLEKTIAGFERQSFQNFELIIADDGSKLEVVEKVKKLINRLPFPVQHIWHEDKGFRKNRILNGAIHHARADYMIFVDQDCVPHMDFVKEHVTHQQPRTALSGRRLELSPFITEQLTAKKIRDGYIEKNLWWIILAIAHRKDNNGVKGIHITNTTLRNFINRKERALVGCNFSVSKADLVAINGFDHRYENPGSGEDSDIEFRLRLNGVKIQSFANAAVQYHLYHKLSNRYSVNENLFASVQKEKKAVTSFGITQQLERN